MESYYKEYDSVSGLWAIFTPEGVELTQCISEEEADGLLSHLNRG